MVDCHPQLPLLESRSPAVLQRRHPSTSLPGLERIQHRLSMSGLSSGYSLNYNWVSCVVCRSRVVGNCLHGDAGIAARFAFNPLAIPKTIWFIGHDHVGLMITVMLHVRGKGLSLAAITWNCSPNEIRCRREICCYESSVDRR